MPIRRAWQIACTRPRWRLSAIRGPTRGAASPHHAPPHGTAPDASQGERSLRYTSSRGDQTRHRCPTLSAPMSRLRGNATRFGTGPQHRHLARPSGALPGPRGDRGAGRSTRVASAAIGPGTTRTPTVGCPYGNSSERRGWPVAARFLDNPRAAPPSKTRARELGGGGAAMWGEPHSAGVRTGGPVGMLRRLSESSLLAIGWSQRGSGSRPRDTWS